MAKLIYEFIEPWEACDQQVFVRQLEKELKYNPNHCVYSRKVKIVGRHMRMDCFLFEITDDLDEYKFADVHLTFGCQNVDDHLCIEKDPKWPSTCLYKSFEAFTLGRMKPDAEDESPEGWPEGWID